MMTKAFALNGAAKVYIIGRRKEKLDEAAKLSPDNIVPVVGDVTSKESLCGVAKQVKREVGFVNLVICNSGTMPAPIGVHPAKASVHEYASAALGQSVDDWTGAFATNSVSIMVTSYAFLELLDAGNKKGNVAGRKSQILVTSSIAGFLRVPGSNMLYGATKAAATHMVKHLAGTLVSYDIRVNAIAPGLFASDLAADLITGLGPKTDDPSDEGALERSIIPAQRTGKAGDVVGTVLYMASQAGAYLNGNITVLDGGRIALLPASY